MSATCLPLAVLLMGVVLGLAGCGSKPVTVPLEASSDAWELRREALLELRDWRLIGRVAVSVDEEAWSANIDWLQRDDQYQMELHGPLGQGRVRIVGNRYSVQMTLGDGRELTAADPESLLQRELGWSLPVRGLSQWVKGVPYPGRAESSLLLDELGRLAELDQEGWHIRYSGYLETAGLDLPRKLRLDNQDVNVRMVVDAWETDTAHLAEDSVSR